MSKKTVFTVIVAALVGAVIGACVCVAILNNNGGVKFPNASMEVSSFPELKEQLAELEGAVIADLEGAASSGAASKYSMLLDGKTRGAKPVGYMVTAENGADGESCMLRCERTEAGHGPFGPGENNVEYSGTYIKKTQYGLGDKETCVLEFSIAGFDYRLAKSGDKTGFDEEAAYEQLMAKAESIIDTAKAAK